MFKIKVNSRKEMLATCPMVMHIADSASRFRCAWIKSRPHGEQCKSNAAFFVQNDDGSIKEMCWLHASMEIEDIIDPLRRGSDDKYFHHWYENMMNSEKTNGTKDGSDNGNG